MVKYFTKVFMVTIMLLNFSFTNIAYSYPLKYSNIKNVSAGSPFISDIQTSTSIIDINKNFLNQCLDLKALDSTQTSEINIPTFFKENEKEIKTMYFMLLKQQYEVYMQEHQSNISTQKYNNKIYEWQLQSTSYIFWLVFIIVIVGVLSAIIHLYFGLPKKSNTESSIRLSTEGIEMKTSLVGITIFFGSLVFFTLYLYFVYPIK